MGGSDNAVKASSIVPFLTHAPLAIEIIYNILRDSIMGSPSRICPATFPGATFEAPPLEASPPPAARQWIARTQFPHAYRA